MYHDVQQGKTCTPQIGPCMVISSVIMTLLPAGLLLLLDWIKGAPHFRSMHLAVLLEARLQCVWAVADAAPS